MTDYKNESWAGIEQRIKAESLAQPGTMLAAIAAWDAVGDFARARTVQALLSEQA